jgi:hypothetical protein
MYCQVLWNSYKLFTNQFVTKHGLSVKRVSGWTKCWQMPTTSLHAICNANPICASARSRRRTAWFRFSEYLWWVVGLLQHRAFRRTYDRTIVRTQPEIPYYSDTCVRYVSRARRRCGDLNHLAVRRRLVCDAVAHGYRDGERPRRIRSCEPATLVEISRRE